MNINRALPLIWKHREQWFSGEKQMVLNLGENKMTIRPKSYDLYVLGEVFWEEVYAPRSTVLTAPAVILDLGANIGAYSVWAARRWNPGRIVAVEMDELNFLMLEENIRLNKLNEKVVPVKAAIWDENGWVGIKRNMINHGKNQACPVVGEDGIQAVTIEKLMSMVGVKKIDIIKMDIEGAEQRLFNKENERIFAQSVGYLVAELHPSKGVQVERIIAYLENIGFKTQIRSQWLTTTVILEATNS